MNFDSYLLTFYSQGCLSKIFLFQEYAIRTRLPMAEPDTIDPL